MSRIFEALNRQPGELAEAALSPLGVNGPAGALTEQAAAPVAKVTEICSSAIRTLPLRIPGAVPVLPFDGDHWEANEQYRIIRTRLIHHSKQPRMIVVSSAGAGDGKTITSVNLAGVLSLKTESKVLLIDADFRRSAIHTQLGLPAEPVRAGFGRIEGQPRGTIGLLALAGIVYAAAASISICHRGFAPDCGRRGLRFDSGSVRRRDPGDASGPYQPQAVQGSLGVDPGG